MAKRKGKSKSNISELFRILDLLADRFSFEEIKQKMQGLSDKDIRNIILKIHDHIARYQILDEYLEQVQKTQKTNQDWTEKERTELKKLYLNKVNVSSIAKIMRKNEIETRKQLIKIKLLTKGANNG